jgi:positive regulator of sigma E activity
MSHELTVIILVVVVVVLILFVIFVVLISVIIVVGGTGLRFLLARQHCRDQQQKTTHIFFL